MVDSGQFDNPDIYITPPDGVQTDEDSADGDQGGMIDNLNGHQLQAEAEAVIRTGRYYRTRLGDEDDEDYVNGDGCSDDEGPQTKRKRQSVSAGKRTLSRTWSKSDLPATE